MIKQILFLLLLGVGEACASDYYVDCNFGSNGNSGMQGQAWRTPLEVTLHSANPGFAPGDAIYFKRGCTWYEGFSLTSSGQSGNLITVDSFNGDGSSSGPTNAGQPPHFTGYLPIADAYWTVSSANIWVSKPLFERNDIKRNVYDRIVTAAIAFTVSALITLHDHFLPK